MTTTLHRKRGRPRAFEDDDVFRIISRLLLDGDLSDVTLERVAKLAGATNQALSQRFSSKAGLLNSYINWLTSIAWADITAISTSTESPVKRLKTLMTLPMNPRVLDNPSPNPEESWIPIILELNRDPELAKINAEGLQRFIKIAIALIDEAQELGELRPANSRLVLELVWSVSVGSTALSEWNDGEDTLSRMRRLMDSVLELFATDPSSTRSPSSGDR